MGVSLPTRLYGNNDTHARSEFPQFAQFILHNMVRSRRNARLVSPEADETPRPGRRHANRTDLSGLDIDDDDDEEYNEEVEGVPKGRKKRRLSDDEEDEEDEEEDHNLLADDENVQDDLEVDADADEDEDEDNTPKPDNATPAAPKRVIKKPKRRGRKPIVLAGQDGFYDDDGNLINIHNDEVVIDEDPKCIEKVDANGILQGDRQYRINTFTVLGQGERLYMVSTEPARLVGFRDSYLLFKTHHNLFKKVCSDAEKMDLIERHIIPNSYKGRSVNLVTARSIFREFGARILKDGKKVIDDFWEQKAIDNGDVPGEYADPTELYKFSLNAASAYSEANPAGSGTPPLAGSALVAYQSDPTWMYQMARRTRDYNSGLLSQRGQTFGGVKDIYTGLNFYPVGTQPTICRINRIGDSSGQLVWDTKLYNPDATRKYMGLIDVPAEVFDDADEETKKAILAQQAYEGAALKL